ncbi:MAG: hypothetical protein U0X39_03265 [Bacteroidales bacterium]
MKKLLLICILCITGIIVVSAQTTGQIVKVKRAYFLNDKQLKGNELQTVLKTVPESAELLKKAKTNTTVGTVFIGASTVFIIYAAVNPPKEDDGPLPGVISDEEMAKWMVPVYCSLGCLAIAAPFLISGGKQFKKSITIYNSKYTPTGYRNEMKMNIGFTPSGLGISCSF